VGGTAPSLGNRTRSGSGVIGTTRGAVPTRGRRLVSSVGYGHGHYYGHGNYGPFPSGYAGRWSFWGSYCYSWWNPHYFWTIYSPFSYQRYTSCFPSYSYSYDYCWWPGRRTYIPVAWYGGYAEPSIVIDIDLGDDDVDGAVAGSGEIPSVPERAAASAEGLADRFITLGDFYFKEGRFADAADAYARARTYAPDDATIHFVLADALFATGDYHFAAYLIAEAVRLDPEIVKAVADKRGFYGDAALFDKQLETLEKYILDKPYDAAAHFVYGYNLYFSGQIADAAKAFEQTLSIEPTHEAAKAFLAGAKERLEAIAPKAEIR